MFLLWLFCSHVNVNEDNIFRWPSWPRVNPGVTQPSCPIQASDALVLYLFFGIFLQSPLCSRVFKKIMKLVYCCFVRTNYQHMPYVRLIYCCGSKINKSWSTNYQHLLFDWLIDYYGPKTKITCKSCRGVARDQVSVPGQDRRGHGWQSGRGDCLWQG